jgi:ATP-dependent DNA helicase RecG
MLTIFAYQAHDGQTKAHEGKDEAHEQLNDTELTILRSCKQPKSTSELLEILGYKSRTGNYKAALANLQKMNLLKMTHPESPKSKFQKYIITKLGIEVLEK